MFERDFKSTATGLGAVFNDRTQDRFDEHDDYNF
jgi:hypothetical protein